MASSKAHVAPASAPSPQLLYRRIVVKAGTNVLTQRSDKLDMSLMASLVAQIAAVRGMGAQVLLVTSGAIAAGREAIGQPSEGRAVPFRQMLAAIGQSRLMHAYQELFSKHGTTVAQALLTHHDVEDRVGYLNVRNTLEGLLDHGVVPIVNENDVVDTEEIGQERFGDNDTLSALVANVIDADLLLMLTDTSGLFTADPNRDPSAKLIPRVERIDDSILALAEPHRSRTTRGGMISKLRAAERATSSGVTVIVGPGADADAIARAAAGEQVGTLFVPTGSANESRKRWLLSGTAGGDGQIVIDEGAVRALRARRGSLLPAGVRGVRGSFDRGDVVTVVGPQGEYVARGIANYDSKEMLAICGARSGQISSRLGYHYGDEAIHRNNMVVLG